MTIVALDTRISRRLVFTLAIFWAWVLIAPLAIAGELKITFIGNEAFHITDGKTTLLSDFPYQSGAYGYMKYEMEKAPPIVDGLSLITHFHSDHWSEALFNSMDLSIVAPDNIVKKLDAKKVTPVSESGQATFKDITVQAIKMEHKFSPEHYSYLVTWHGLRLYFPGDTETPADVLKQKKIDVMFITPWLVRTIERQKLTLDAKVLVLYHQKIDEKVPPFQDYKRMQQYQSFAVRYDNRASGDRQTERVARRMGIEPEERWPQAQLKHSLR